MTHTDLARAFLAQLVAQDRQENGTSAMNETTASQIDADFCERFWSKVNKSDDGCWEWQARRFPTGYGCFGIWRNGRTTPHYAHRIAWELAFGPIPDGLFVCHHCDNRACCRPEHLFLGTPADNVADMDAKGRRVNKPLRGSAQYKAKLTDDAVREILSYPPRKINRRALAETYGVSMATIDQVRQRNNWRHVE